MISSRVNNMSLEDIKKILEAEDDLEAQIGWLGEKRIYVSSTGESVSWDRLACRLLKLREDSGEEVISRERYGLANKMIRLYDDAEELADKSLLAFFRKTVLGYLDLDCSKTIYDDLVYEKEDREDDIQRRPSEYAPQKTGFTLKLQSTPEPESEKPTAKEVDNSRVLVDEKAYLALENSLNRWLEEASEGEKSIREEAIAKIKDCFFNEKTILDLSGIKITSFPRGLKLTHLKELNLSCPELESFPEDLNFPNLENLDLRFCFKLEALPDNLNFPSLKRLSLDWCTKFKSFPANPNFPNLEELVLAQCHNLKTIPDHLDLPSLRFLSFTSSHDFEFFPGNLNFPKLEELDFGSCRKLKIAPGAIRKLPCLKRLKLPNGSILGLGIEARL